jgi:hypothetical protein
MSALKKVTEELVEPALKMVQREIQKNKKDGIARMSIVVSF